MSNSTRTARRLGLLLAAAFAIQTGACGTLLYPERKGQKEGKLDPTVVALDGIGLLFFLVPGVIAFAVDFHNGTIYLPESESDGGTAAGPAGAAPTEGDGMIAVHVGADELDPTRICTVIAERTGYNLDPNDPRLVVSGVPSIDALPSRLQGAR